MALDVLESMAEEYDGESLGNFAAGLRAEIKEDRQAPEELLERTGPAATSPVKEAGAWLTEKGTRIKLRRGAGEGLGTLEALEALSLGILGKRALWRASRRSGPPIRG